MGLDVEAYLGFGIQVRSEDSGYISDNDEFADIVENIYGSDTFPTSRLDVIYGGYEGQDVFVLYKDSILRSDSWAASAFKELPKLDTIAAQALREFEEENGIDEPHEWWLIPYYG